VIAFCKSAAYVLVPLKDERLAEVMPDEVPMMLLKRRGPFFV
jgi:hypothetical protein